MLRRLVLIALGLVACSKQEAGGAFASASAAASTSASAAASPSASAAAPASAAASATATPKAATSAVVVPSAAASAIRGGPIAGECGAKPLPDCPLQAWMKKNLPTDADADALAGALEKTADFAPPGYTNWASIAKDGARAAKDGDVAAAKRACRSCHEQYKAKYKAELRARKI